MKLASTAVTALLLPACAAAALAPRSAHAQAPERGAAMLTTYAEAYLDIAEIDAERNDRTRHLRDSTEIAAVTQQADSARLAVLQERQITPEDYDAIAQLIQADAEVRQEFEVVLARAREQREGADPPDARPTGNPGAR